MYLNDFKDFKDFLVGRFEATVWEKTLEYFDPKTNAVVCILLKEMSIYRILGCSSRSCRSVNAHN